MTQSLPALHGHRGARGRRPENTLEAIGFAITCGADGAEVDLCVTADNTVVIHHDLALSPLLTRDARGNWIDHAIPVRQQTQQQLQRYNVGQIRPDTAYQRRFSEQIPLGFAGIPTLEAMIEYILDTAGGDFVFNLELKSDPTRPELTPAPERYVSLVLDLIHRYRIGQRTFLQSFDWRLIRMVHQRDGELLTGLLTDIQGDTEPVVPDQNGDATWTDGFTLDQFDDSIPAMVKAAGSAVWSSNYRDLTEQLVRQAHQLGLEVYVWTVNETVDMQRMIDWEVDAITTDYPDRLAALFDQARSNSAITTR